MNTLKRFCVLALCAGIFMVPSADAQAHSEKDLVTILLKQLLVSKHKTHVIEHHGRYYKYVNGHFVYVQKQPDKRYSKKNHVKFKHHKNKYAKHKSDKHKSGKRH